MTPTLIGEMAHAQRELNVISPHFVPGQQSLLWIGDLRPRKVRVSVLTSSLAANDVVAVHGGYADYRVPLLTALVRRCSATARSVGTRAGSERVAAQ